MSTTSFLELPHGALPKPSGRWLSVTEGLAVVGGLGERFRLGSAHSGASPDGGPNVDRRSDVPERLVERSAFLGTDRAAVVGSLFLSGYAYRIAAPAIASWVLHRRVPLMLRESLRIAWADGRPVDVTVESLKTACLADDDEAVATGGRAVGSDDELVDLLVATLLDAHLLLVRDHVLEITGAPQRLLRGAIASQVGAIFAWIDRQRPCPMSDTAAFARLLFDRAGSRLASTGELGVVGIDDLEHEQLFWNRRTCCLAYLRPDSSYCATCNLLPWEDRTAAWSRVARETRAAHNV